MAFRPLFKASILIKADMSANSWKTRIVSTRMIVFGCFTAPSFWTVVIRLHIYITDWFLRGVFVFDITKTKTPEFTVKFDLNFSGKSRTEDNLTD